MRSGVECASQCNILDECLGFSVSRIKDRQYKCYLSFSTLSDQSSWDNYIKKYVE